MINPRGLDRTPILSYRDGVFLLAAAGGPVLEAA
jgi:hypothetical protein